MNISDVRIGIRVRVVGNRIGPSPYDVTWMSGLVSRVAEPIVYVVLDKDHAEFGDSYAHAFNCANVESMESGAALNSFSEPPLEPEQTPVPIRPWMPIQWTNQPILTPVPTTVEQLVQAHNAGLDVALAGNGSNMPVFWPRASREPRTATEVTATAQRFEEERRRLMVAAAERQADVSDDVRDSVSYLELYRQHLARYGLHDDLPEPIPPKAVAKPLAIGTPPRKLFLPPKP